MCDLICLRHLLQDILWGNCRLWVEELLGPAPTNYEIFAVRKLFADQWPDNMLHDHSSCLM